MQVHVRILPGKADDHVLLKDHEGVHTFAHCRPHRVGSESNQQTQEAACDGVHMPRQMRRVREGSVENGDEQGEEDVGLQVRQDSPHHTRPADARHPSAFRPHACKMMCDRTHYREIALAERERPRPVGESSLDSSHHTTQYLEVCRPSIGRPHASKIYKHFCVPVRHCGKLTFRC